VAAGGGIAPSYGRTSRNFRLLAANLRGQRRPCCLCGQPINYELEDPNHPDAFTVEHKLSRESYPWLAEDPGNLDAAHKRCNSRKGAGAAAPGLGSTSAAW
jgi:5-methylcytosine-specific restriction endonuclease McrA